VCVYVCVCVCWCLDLGLLSLQNCDKQMCIV
jgi:hypothetical protein